MVTSLDYMFVCDYFQKLKVLYEKIGAALQLIPKDAAYRKYTEQIVSERLDLVNKVMI